MAAKPLFIMNPNTSHGLSSMMPAGEASQVKGASHQHQPGLSGDSPAGMPPVIHGSLLAANDAIAVRQGLPGARRPGRNGQDEDDRACRDEERDEQGNPVQHADGRDDDDSCAALLAAPAGEGAAASSAGSTGAAAAMGATGAAGIASTTGGSGAAAAGTAGAATGISPSAAALTQTLLMGGAVALGGFGGSDSTASDSRSANGRHGNDTPSIDPGSPQNPGNAQTQDDTGSLAQNSLKPAVTLDAQPVPSNGQRSLGDLFLHGSGAHGAQGGNGSHAGNGGTSSGNGSGDNGNPAGNGDAGSGASGNGNSGSGNHGAGTGNADVSPEYVVLQRVSLNGSSQDSAQGGLWLRGTDGSEPRLLKEGDVIARADFDRVYWNTEGNTGGEFQFVASNARGVPVSNATPQIVPIYESPEPPVYDADAQTRTLTVAHDQTLSLPSALLAGSDAGKAPAGGIRIDRIDAASQDTDHGTLYRVVTDASGTPQRIPVQAGTVISPSQLSELAWDSAHNAGGSFTFTALDGRGNPIEGAAPQKITVHESPAVPAYSATPVVHVGHDEVTPLKAQLFTGDNDTLKPAAVRIDKIQATNADGSVSEQGTPALLLDPDGDGPKEATLVSEGQRISADDFGKLRWDAHGSDGGRLAFTPVDADGVAYGTTQQVTIFEQPLPPVYAQDIDPIQAGFQKMVNLSDHLSTIIGSDATRAPSAIRIDELTAPHPQDGAQTPLFLKNDDGSLTPVTAGDGHNVIQAADFSRLVWDASKSDGGWFIFEALDAQGEPFPNATGQHLAHRVQIDEDAVAGHTRDSEDYVANNVANDSITWLTPNAYGPAPETLRFFRLGDIRAWESGGQTRIVMDAATSPDGKEAAYEIIRHAGLTLEEAQAQAAARGAKLLTIDSQQELDWLQKQVTDGRFGIHNEPDKGTDDTDLSGYVYTSRLGTADGTPEAQGSNAKGFIIEYNDYKSPLRLHSATDSGKFEYLHTGDVLSNHDMQRLTWDSHQNNGGKIWLVELEPQADDPTKASDKTTGEWIGWGFEERDRLGTYGTWEEVPNRLGVRSVSATSQEAPSATTQADADTHAAVDASQLNLWKGTSALLDDLQHASLALI